MTTTEPRVTTSRYLSGNFAPVHDEVDVADLPVSGASPRSSNGRLLRNGPNPMRRADPPTYHWFTGTAWCTACASATARRSGTATARCATPSRRRARRGWPETPVAGVTAWAPARNTNVIGHAGTHPRHRRGGPAARRAHLRARPVGALRLRRHAAEAAFTAHPKRDPATGELHAVTYCWEWDHMQYVVVGTDGRVRTGRRRPGARAARWCTTAPSPSPRSCCSTCRCVFDLDAAMAQARGSRTCGTPTTAPASGCCRCDGRGRRRAVVRDRPLLRLPPAQRLRPARRPRRARRRAPPDDVRQGPARARTRARPTLDRWTLDPTSGKAREERLDDQRPGVPPPRRAPARPPPPLRLRGDVPAGRSSIGGGRRSTTSIAGTTEVHDFGPGRVSLEPVFVPRADDAAEDDGWVMSLRLRRHDRPQRRRHPARPGLHRRPGRHDPPPAARPVRLPRQLGAGPLLNRSPYTPAPSADERSPARGEAASRRAAKEP